MGEEGEKKLTREGEDWTRFWKNSPRVDLRRWRAAPVRDRERPTVVSGTGSTMGVMGVVRRESEPRDPRECRLSLLAFGRGMMITPSATDQRWEVESMGSASRMPRLGVEGRDDAGVSVCRPPCEDERVDLVVPDDEAVDEHELLRSTSAAAELRGGGVTCRTSMADCEVARRSDSVLVHPDDERGLLASTIPVSISGRSGLDLLPYLMRDVLHFFSPSPSIGCPIPSCGNVVDRVGFEGRLTIDSLSVCALAHSTSSESTSASRRSIAALCAAGVRPRRLDAVAEKRLRLGTTTMGKDDVVGDVLAELLLGSTTTLSPMLMNGTELIDTILLFLACERRGMMIVGEGGE
jgi:hypothetical protein